MAPATSMMPRSPKMTVALQPVILDEKIPFLEPLRRLVSRDTTPTAAGEGPDRMINLMISILGLVFISLILVSVLFLFRRRRRLQRLRGETLPTYNAVNQPGLSIETKHNGHASVVFIGRDGQPMLQNPASPPHSPDNVPQIHITFPDEQDEQGQQTSGRVLIVRVGDNATIGLEPMQNEQLPAYEKESKGQFQTIDMDRIGGLKEKERTVFQ